MKDCILNPTHEVNAEWVDKLVKAYPDETYFIAGNSYEIDDNGKKNISLL